MQLGVGSLIGGRFEVEATAAAGGMAVVFRARDRHTGETVALKLLRGDEDVESAARFDREASLLARLTHPRLVRYVDHGRTSDGQAWIATEWLEGETLSERLSREPLRISETLALMGGVADALSEVHRRGVIHRDVKPSNIFLVGRDVSRVKVIDFGIARFTHQAHEVTGTGALVGTFAYMSPEQAWGRRELGASTDVFSLGCVFFMCLTGQKPFAAKHTTAILAKILLEEAPRVATLRPDLPPELDELVAKMMTKEPAKRLPDASAVALALAALEIDYEDVSVRSSDAPVAALTSSERRIMTVLVARDLAPAEESGVRPTLVEDDGATVVEAPDPRWRAVRSLAADHGARVHALADGTLLASFASSASPIEHSLKAARYALKIRDLAPEHPIALATGLAQLSGTVPVGEVIDRAVEIVRHARPGQVVVDDVTAGLLGGRFVLDGETEVLCLLSERDPGAERRELLGRPTPFVGRRREITMLEASWDECVEEEIARVVLVTGPAGYGKSRLRYELLARLTETDEAPTVLLARADPVTAGAPLGVLADALRRAAQIHDAEAPTLRHKRLRARLARSLSNDRAALERCSTFLGELVGAPVAVASSELEAARADPRLMGDRMRAAFEDWLEAELRQGPLVFVVEDLQWGDQPSIAFLDGALCRLAERSWLLLALARPEVEDRFPGLWAGRDVQEIPLAKLSKKAATELVHDVLGAVEESVVERLVEVANGNAFYLEELIRTVADGAGDELPKTVLAMVQARLEALPEEGRRLLRAASVFGKAFWRSGIVALFGGDDRTIDIDGWIDDLVARELVSRRAESRFRDEPELAFRHSLVREGAYATLTDEDRRRGHALAAEWLEAAGESEPFLLATHHAAGGARARAAPYFVEAAEQALEANDLDGAVDLAERAIVDGVTPEVRGHARLLQAEANRWRGQPVEGLACAEEAARLLPAGTALFYRASTEHFIALVNRGQREEGVVVAGRAGIVRPREDARSAHAICVARAFEVDRSADGDIAELWVRVRDRTDDPLAAGWIAAARASEAARAGDLGASVAYRQAAVDAFDQLGDRRTACLHRVNAGHTATMLGEYERAEETLRTARRDADRMGLAQIGAFALHNLGLVVARLGNPERGLSLERDALAEGEAMKNVALQAVCHLYLAEILLGVDRAEESLSHARTATALFEHAPSVRVLALAVRARAEARLGRVEAALESSDEAMALLAEHGADESAALVYVCRMEALDAAGRPDEAVEVAKAGFAMVERATANISDRGARARVLDRVPEHAALAARLA